MGRYRKQSYTDGFWEVYLDRVPTHDEVYEFYNVLWVKWEGNHILREGVGRVEKSIWEQQDLEEMDFELH